MSDLFNVTAETAVLSIILNSPNKIFDLTILKPYMFSNDINESIFTTCHELIEKGSVPDINLLESYAKSGNKLDKLGGREYLDYIQKQITAFDNNNIKEYEKLVANSYKARTLIKVTSGISSSTLLNSENVDTAIDNLRKSLDSISESSGGDLTESLNSIVDSSWNVIYERAQNPGISGITSGISTVDLVTSGIMPGDVWVVGGRPGSGKSALFCNMVLNQAEHKIKSLLFSREMQKQPLIERFVAIKTGIPLTPNIRMGQLTKAELETISRTLKEIKDFPIFIDANYSGSLDYVENTVRRFKKTGGIDVVYIDYLQLLAERDEGSTHELGRIMRRAKLLALELDIAFVIASQLNRNVEMRENKRPVLSDFRQSGNIEEDADLAVGLYRDEYYNRNSKSKGVMEFIINKHRNGPTGIIPLTFREDTNKIEGK